MYQRTIKASSRVCINLKTSARHGEHTPTGSRILWKTDKVLVFRRAGYSDNPGARFSGLRHYYAAEDIVYLIGEPTNDPNVFWCYPIGSTEVSAHAKVK